MAKRPPVAKSELEVAQIVWERGRASVREVLEALPPRRNLDFKTVQTYLRRLEAKGYLRKHREGRAMIYLPRVEPKRVMREVIDDFLERLFGGESLPLVQHLINDRGLSAAEIRELRATLDELEGRKS
jgi:BlaI family transcriptional regulator, penicillinase repressor